MKLRVLCSALSAMVVLCCGCGGDPLGRKAISGTVTIDGAPVEMGNIGFEPQGGGELALSSGSAVTGGKFKIEADGGLPPGKYVVRIFVPKPGTGGTVADPSALPGEAVAPPEEMAPPEWNVKSTQTIEVKSDGTNDFKFDIVAEKK